MSCALLDVRGLCRRFGGVVAVDQVSFSVAPGSITALIGPNGAGKTTVFNLITRVLQADGGEVEFDGRSILRRKQHELAGLGLTRTFQNLQLFPDLTVLENVMVGYHSRMRSTFLDHVLLRSRSARRDEQNAFDEALKQLERIGLADRALERAGDLPCGLQRMVELARCLAAAPRLILLDEPMAGLTAGEKRSLGSLMLRLRDEGITFLFVEHDMPAVMSLADHVVALQFGAVLAQGSPDQIRRDDRVIAAYLGEEAV